MATASRRWNFDVEDATPEIPLNEAIWRSVKGRRSDMPDPRHDYIIGSQPADAASPPAGAIATATTLLRGPSRRAHRVPPAPSPHPPRQGSAVASPLPASRPISARAAIRRRGRLPSGPSGPQAPGPARRAGARPAGAMGTSALPRLVYVGINAAADASAVQSHRIVTERRGPCPSRINR